MSEPHGRVTKCSSSETQTSATCDHSASISDHMLGTELNCNSKVKKKLFTALML